MRILFDIDDTITNFSEVLLKRLNTSYETSYSKNNINSWNWLKSTFENPWKPLEDKSFWDEIEVDKNAIILIENLIENGHEVYLATASFPNDALGYKIRKTLEFFNKKIMDEGNVIVCYNKALINCDVRVDDAIHNLIDRNSINFLYTQPWNKDINVADYPNCIRINSLSQLNFLLKLK